MDVECQVGQSAEAGDQGEDQQACHLRDQEPAKSSDPASLQETEVAGPSNRPSMQTGTAAGGESTVGPQSISVLRGLAVSQLLKGDYAEGVVTLDKIKRKCEIEDLDCALLRAECHILNELCEDDIKKSAVEDFRQQIMDSPVLKVNNIIAWSNNIDVGRRYVGSIVLLYTIKDKCPHQGFGGSKRITILGETVYLSGLRTCRGTSLDIFARLFLLKILFEMQDAIFEMEDDDDDIRKYAEARSHIGLGQFFLTCNAFGRAIEEFLKGKPKLEAMAVTSPDRLNAYCDLMSSLSYGYARKNTYEIAVDTVYEGLATLKTDGPKAFIGSEKSQNAALEQKLKDRLSYIEKRRKRREESIKAKKKKREELQKSLRAVVNSAPVTKM